MNIAFYPQEVFVKLFTDKELFVKSVFAIVCEYRDDIGRYVVDFYTSRNRAARDLYTSDQLKSIPGYETGTENSKEALDMEEAVFGGKEKT